MTFLSARLEYIIPSWAFGFGTFVSTKKSIRGELLSQSYLHVAAVCGGAEAS